MSSNHEPRESIRFEKKFPISSNHEPRESIRFVKKSPTPEIKLLKPSAKALIGVARTPSPSEMRFPISDNQPAGSNQLK